MAIKRKKRKEVWVLNIKCDDGTICTSVYSTLKKLIASVREEYREHGIEDLFDSHNVADELENEFYNTDGANTYLVEVCEVN